ncbi:glycosyltransferase [Bacteroidales bacterium OttesenSCG-928-I21]|nr:glycosyltransferase [Bacteroidales bacterium OttesenSCG-928-I21]
MKIAIIKPTITISPTGGVKVQAEMWKRGLELFDNEVILVNHWDDNDWKSFDVILFIQFGGLLYDYVKNLKTANNQLAIAPIIDTNLSPFRYRMLLKYLGVTKLHFKNRFHDFYSCRNDFKMYYVRSEYEKRYVTESLKISEDKICIVPLSYRVSPPEDFPDKENFCFHASLLADKRKNVVNLIRAAQKYKFPLILAGNLRNEKEKAWLNELITGYDNISFVGKLTDEELFDYYKRAKVFALPSINEGVGMVALEAAAYGCEIVLTELGAPKEYYKGQVHLVNPYDIDDIGTKIMSALKNPVYQPTLKKIINENYSLYACSKLLNNSLKEKFT